MKKHLLILFILLSIGHLATAQKEYRLAKSTGTLLINLEQAVVEGYDGKEIIFSGKSVTVEQANDERAKGLVPISSTTEVDNTGLGISVVVNGSDIKVKRVGKEPTEVITIKVPQNMKVCFYNAPNQIYSSFLQGYNVSATANTSATQELVLRNLKGEIEVSVSNNKIRLENNTGPMNIKTVHGAVEAIFKNEIKGPISIISVDDYVDVTMPANTKANIELSTGAGKLYAGKEFSIERDSVDTKKSTQVRYATIDGKVADVIVARSKTAPRAVTIVGAQGTGDIVINGSPIRTQAGAINTQSFTFGYGIKTGDQIKGKLNGGGVDLIFKSTNKNVYLRQ